jgi:hypothetical protein
MFFSIEFCRDYFRLLDIYEEKEETLNVKFLLAPSAKLGAFAVKKEI